MIENINPVASLVLLSQIVLVFGYLALTDMRQTIVFLVLGEVGATVSYLLTHTQCFVTELAHRAANVEYGYNSTHIIYIYKVGCLWTIAGVSSSDAVIL